MHIKYKHLVVVCSPQKICKEDVFRSWNDFNCGSPFWVKPSTIFFDNVPQVFHIYQSLRQGWIWHKVDFKRSLTGLRYLIFTLKKSHLDSFNLNLYSWILERTLWICSLCCSTFWLISSKYATEKSRSLCIESITCWKVARATLIPNGGRPNLPSA